MEDNYCTPAPKSGTEQESESRSRGGELPLLLQCSRLINCDTENDVLLRAMLQKLIAVLEPAQAGAFYLYKPGASRLVVACALGYDSDSVQQLTLRVGESIAGKAFQSAQPQLCATPGQVAAAMADLTPQNRLHFEQAITGLKQPHSALCVPVVCGETKIGVLVLENWRGNAEFSPSDVDIARAFAALAGVAMERLRLAGEVKRLSTTLTQTNEAQDYMMSTLSHEMRTPLASIKGYATALLLEDVQWDEATQHEYLQIIVEESDTLNDIIADLLETSMIDAGQFPIEKQPTRLSHLAQEAIDEVSRRTDKHHFLLSFSSDLPILGVDPGRMKRVLLNLMDNAVKYSPAGGLIVVRGEVSGDEAVVSVADQGQGIPPEYLNRLFERFFRVKFVWGRHVAGSGLGLPIARKIVELHGGRIWAESKEGEGSTFYFTIPLEGLSRAADQEQGGSE